MKILDNRDIAVIIPARDEAERIGACLTAFARQCADRILVVLVVNNTTDSTKEIAQSTARQHSLPLELLDCQLPPNEGVGTARKIGCDYAMQMMPRLRYVSTTDADCLVAPDWISRNIAHLQKVDAVCGKIGLIEEEAGILNGMNRGLATNEGAYRDLVQQFYAQHAEGCDDIAGTHGEAAGASLAFRANAYRAVGGFDPVICGEDRRIVRKLRSSGHTVLHADDVLVRVSCRLAGRASGGMSDALKARITGTDYVIDDCLPAASWLVASADAGTLGVWPPQVPAEGHVHVRDLPRNIETLTQFQSLRRLAKAAVMPASVSEVPPSHLGLHLSDRGSAIVPADPKLQRCIPRKAIAPQHSQIETLAFASIERNVK